MKGALAKRMATKQQEEAVAVPASTNMPVDAETGLREDLVALGVRFLCGPNNSERDVSELLVFLEVRRIIYEVLVEIFVSNCMCQPLYTYTPKSCRAKDSLQMKLSNPLQGLVGGEPSRLLEEQSF